jgi:hypothetical protein
LSEVRTVNFEDEVLDVGYHFACRGCLQAACGAPSLPDALRDSGLGCRRRQVAGVDEMDAAPLTPITPGPRFGVVEEVRVDGDRADVAEVGLGDGGAMDLGPQHGAQRELRL